MRRAVALAALVAAVACRPPSAREEGSTDGGQANVGPAAATLATDSTQYTVRFINGMYRANIGYAYTNRTGDAVSATHCHTPPPPVLEKRVGGRWVRAYSAIQLLCLSIPHFQIAAGASYRGTLDFAAAPPGRNVAPALEVESIPGTYRLRWVLRAGKDPEAPGAGTVEAISNEFRFVER